MYRLVIIQGDQHHFYNLPPNGGEVSLGRAPSNTLTLDDDGVSRHHCVIEPHAGGYRVKDLKSFNGTFVNGYPIREQPLASWDKVQLGAVSVFLVKTDASADEELERKLGRYQVLFELNKAINSELDRGKLLEKIMDSAIELCSAERGFIITRNDESGRLTYEVARNIDKVEIFAPEFNTSSNIIKKVLDTGEPILTSNAQSDFGEYLSIVDLQLRSLMCVPLKVKERVLGTVYLDSRLHESTFTPAEMQLLMAFTDQAAIAFENAQLLAKAKQQERQAQELRIASSIQKELLPRSDPEVDGLIVCGRTLPARQVGGDYYDYIETDVALYLGIGDVSGKGVPAGLTMVMLRSLLRPLVHGRESTSEIVRLVNRHLTSDLKKEMFVSFLLMRFDFDEQVLTYTGAGHECLIIYRKHEQETEVKKVGGIVLGVLPDLQSMLTEVELPLDPGDTVVVYTDGITESMNRQGEEFGLDRLAGLVQEHGDRPLDALRDAIFDAVLSFQTGLEQHDDMTVLLLRLDEGLETQIIQRPRQR